MDANVADTESIAQPSTDVLVRLAVMTAITTASEHFAKEMLIIAKKDHALAAELLKHLMDMLVRETAVFMARRAQLQAHNGTKN